MLLSSVLYRIPFENRVRKGQLQLFARSPRNNSTYQHDLELFITCLTDVFCTLRKFLLGKAGRVLVWATERPVGSMSYCSEPPGLL